MKSVIISIAGIVIILISAGCGETGKQNLKQTKTGNKQAGSKKPEKKLLMKKMWIKARSGLRMRNSHGLKEEIIVVIPYNSKITVLEKYGPEKKISGATGRWCKVKWKAQQGWVFGGFLSDKEMPHVVVSRRYLVGVWCLQGTGYRSAQGCYQLNRNQKARIIHKVAPRGTWSLEEGHIVHVNLDTAPLGPDGEKYISRPYSVRMVIKQVINRRVMLVDIEDDFLDRKGLKKMIKAR